MYKRDLLFSLSSITLFLLVVVCFVSCPINGTTPGNDTPNTGSSDTVVRFGLPSPLLAAAKSSRSVSETTNTLVVTDLKMQRPTVKFPLKDIDNSISLARDGIYLFTFLNVPEATGIASTQKSISTAISTIGSLGIVTVGLGSLPLSTDASAQVDLGNLTQHAGQLTSNMGASDVVSLTGYSTDEIDIIRDFDAKNNHARNPDINQNGVFDSDEGLDWNFYQRIIFFLGFDDYDFSTATFHFPASSFTPGDIWIHFPNNFIQSDGIPIRLRLPQNVSCTVSGNPVTELIQFGDQMYFLIKNVIPGTVISSPPYDGDYAIITSSATYAINDVNFNKASTDYEGLYLPIIIIDKAEDGKYSEVRSRWIAIRGETFVAVDRSLVKNSGMIVESYVGLEFRVQQEKQSYFETLGYYTYPADSGWIIVGITYNPIDSDSKDLSAFGFTDIEVKQFQVGATDVNGNRLGIHFWSPSETAFLPTAANVSAVASDKASLQITYNGGDTASSVTGNLTLPTMGPNGTTINWISDQPSIVSSTGVVTRPASTSVVTLTATIVKGGASDIKMFQVTVIASSTTVTDAQAVAADKASLQIAYASGDTASSITANIALPLTGSSGTTINWISDQPSIVSSTGVVTRPANTSVVTLIATIVKGSASDTKVFQVTVLSTYSGYSRISAVADTFLVNGSFTTYNYGGNWTIEIGYDPLDHRGLIRFDLSSIPSGSFVSDAIFEIYGTGEVLSLHELLVDWDEGNGNAQANATGACWVARRYSTVGDAGTAIPWASPGCLAPEQDYSETIVASAASEDGIYHFSLGSSLVQRWINDPSSNHGLLVVDADSSGGKSGLLNRESENAGSLYIKLTR